MPKSPARDNPGNDPAQAAALRAQAALMGVSVDARQAARMLQLLDELALWNRAYNLTAVEARATMITHHLLDSLAASADLVGERIADLGTGAGFPGLPLAILHPARHFTLIDGTAKKIRFVAHAARTLGLGNVEAVHQRAETLVVTEPFDTLLARAVASLPALAQLAWPLARPGTRLIAYKGQRPEAELAALPENWRLLEVRTLRVPGLDATRHLVLLEARAAPAASPAA
jgi:16S rRNA (guanine527-N7)-methyltransferase